MVAGIVASWLQAATSGAEDNSCQEAQGTLGIGLRPASEERPNVAPSLVITEVTPLSQGARIGLRVGDIVEQVNSWQTQDCQSYQKAVQDARGEHKALLLLINRKDQRLALVFESEVWPRKDTEHYEQRAEVTLQSIVTVPLSPTVKDQVRHTGAQALAILHEVAALAVFPGNPSAYAQRVATAKTQLATLAHAGISEAERRVISGAKIVLGYYLVAQEILEYKQTLVTDSAKGPPQRRNTTATPAGSPYLLNSPVAGWLEQYPFLQVTVRQSPQKVGFMEREGRWDPEQAVQLLWEKANRDAATLAQWLQG
jgi:hypothetical protein